MAGTAAETGNFSDFIKVGEVGDDQRWRLVLGELESDESYGY